jgi:hypothetical protein
MLTLKSTELLDNMVLQLPLLREKRAALRPRHRIRVVDAAADERRCHCIGHSSERTYIVVYAQLCDRAGALDRELMLCSLDELQQVVARCSSCSGAHSLLLPL